ncbi:MAG TPA: YciI family protein [Natronosporangium sp.]
MKYLILIYSNPASREIWEGFSEAEQAEGYAYYAGLTEQLVDSGELIVSEALADASHTKRVTVRDGETITSDGPFAEVKEQLAGFYLVDCESSERAVEIAAKMPEAAFGLIEVRPVLDLSAAGM